MENRRRFYRYPFNPADGLQAGVAVEGRQQEVPAVVANLSIEGARLELPNLPGLKPGLRIRIALKRATGSHIDLDQQLSAQIRYLHKQAERCACGVEFLTSAEPKARDQQEQTLWRFLLNEQSRERRRQLDKAG